MELLEGRRELAGPAPWPLVAARLPALRASTEHDQPRGDERQANATLQIIAACTQYSRAFDREMRTAATSLTTPISSGQLAHVWAAADMASVLAPEKAYHIALQAYGYESYLIAPERGVRQLCAAALELYRVPMEDAAGAVRSALLSAAEAAIDAIPSVPDLLRQQISTQAQSCIDSWHHEAATQLAAVLVAEQKAPEQKAFEPLRHSILQLLEPPANSQSSRTVTAAAASTPVLVELKQEAQQAPEAEFFMGELLKLNRRGRWQRRFFAMDAQRQALLYSKAPGDRPARVFSLQGATLLLEVVQAPGATTKKGATHNFQLKVLEGVSGNRLITLRASSHGSKEAWCQQLQAAIAGAATTSKSADSSSSSAVAAAAPALQKSPSVASSDGGSGSPVRRKISTAVFAEEAFESGEATHNQVAVGEVEEEQAMVAADDALLAAISAQATARQPTPREALILAAVLEVASDYLQSAGARLRGLTQRIIATAMLLDRQDELRQGLLGLLLPPGAAPPALD